MTSGGWQTKSLGDVCVIDKNQGIYKGLPYVGLEDIESNTGRFLGTTKPLAVKSSTFAFSPEHVLYGRLRPYLKKVMVPDFAGHCSTEIFPLKPLPGLIREYLHYWLLQDAITAKINATSTGTRMPRADVNEVLGFEFPLPPLIDQRRIVAILDEAFEGIATVKAKAEKNLGSARAVFDSYLESVFVGRGLGWEDRLLGECATFRNGINFTQSSRGETVQIVGVKDFQSHFWAPLGDLDTVVTDARLPDSDLLRENDILFVRSNGNLQLIGRCLLVGTITGRVTHSGFTIRARLADGSVDPRFLCHFLKSGYARRTMIAGGTGTNIKSLNQATLVALVVPTPPLLEQAAIVERIQALADEASSLSDTYERKLAALEELKKSLLHSAFSGQL